jgi:uncharacterized membrane protein
VRITYLEGDPCSPKYVRGALEHAGFDVAMPEKGAATLPETDAYLLSDVRAEDLSEGAVRQLQQRVRDGKGLLMAGGWTSLGRGGYARHAIGKLLPVELEDGDDRVNVPAGLFLVPPADHEALRGLPWSQPAVLTGYNRVRVRQGARTLLQARTVEAVEGRAAQLGDAVPILAAWEEPGARVGVLATDLAPHWSGGWTDWGPPSVDVGEGEELGTGYVTFVAQLMRWLGRA